MTILIQSSEEFSEVADFEPETGRLERFRSPSHDLAAIRGHYQIIGDVPVILYRANSGLRLMVGKTTIDIDDQTSAILARQGSSRLLSVTRNSTTLIDFRYSQPPLEPPLGMDPTPFVEEEDFDFGLFIANVLQNARRRAEIYTGLLHGHG